MIDSERELQDDSKESKIIEFGFDFAEKFKIEVGVISENQMNDINEINSN